MISSVSTVTSTSAFTTGVQGLQNSQQQITRAAEEVAQAGSDELSINNATINDANLDTATLAGNDRSVQASQSNERYQRERDLAEPLIEIKQQQQVFDASANIVKSADEALGTLLDTRA